MFGAVLPWHVKLTSDPHKFFGDACLFFCFESHEKAFAPKVIDFVSTPLFTAEKTLAFGRIPTVF
jgi:hypothetical protein